MVMMGCRPMRLVGTFLLLALAPAIAASELRIVAPSPAGSSWDQLAQALRSGLSETPDEGGATIVNAPGNGGVVGLGAFLADGLDEAVLVTGLTMLDASYVYRSPVGLERLTPIARLATEPFGLAVPAASAIRTVADLRTAAGEDIGRITWGGGPFGSIDQVAATLLVQALGADAARGTYVPFLSSQEGVAAAAEGRVAAVFLPLGELAAELKTSRIRLIAVSADERLAGVEAPALAQEGVPLVLGNWRGLLARPDLPAPVRERIVTRVAAVIGTPGWREFLDRKGWSDAWLPGAGFSDFISVEAARVRRALKVSGFLKRDG